MKSPLRKAAFFILILSLPINAAAQTSNAPTAPSSGGFDMTSFPQWAQDLRRGEIVAFGSFPFTFFFTSFFMDISRMASNNWNFQYAPWPLKPAGAISMTRDEQLLTLGIAAGSAVIIALVDHFIVQYERGKEREEILSLPPGTPIIINRPLGSEETPPGESDSDTGAETTAETVTP